LYARLGGVYPISLFCDRLVDALVGDTSVRITLDAERTMVSLKYLFTELVCALAGGPETMTAPSLATTQLQLRSQDYFKLLACVAKAADHFENPVQAAADLASVLYRAMDLIRAPDAADSWNAEIAGPAAEKILRRAGAKTHAAIKSAVDRIATDVRMPVLYVPSGKGGFVLAMEHGFDDAEKARRLAQTNALGFEDSAPGVAMLPRATDKDVLFLIDVSGSMTQQNRIENATTNSVKIFNDFTNADDAVGVVYFDHRFKPQPGLDLGPRRSMITKVPKCTGGTAFYDALIKATKIPPQRSNSYLVALTDGYDGHSRSPMHEAQAAIAASPWTLLIIGLQVPRGGVPP
jgi:hypothetical protein